MEKQDYYALINKHIFNIQKNSDLQYENNRKLSENLNNARINFFGGSSHRSVKSEIITQIQNTLISLKKEQYDIFLNLLLTLWMIIT